nr:hypothetical protein Tm_TraesCS2A03G1276000 [Triticum monococcum]
MAASVADHLMIYGQSFAETFLVPPGVDEEEAATATEETSFRVIWVVLLQAKQMALVFSSRTGQWRALTRSESLPLPDFTWMACFRSRHYAHGCFYWISGEKLLVLDIQRMEFSMADHPPCARAPSDDVAIAEAGQGTIRMFVPTPNTARRSFTVWRNNGGISTQWQWQMENETILLPSGSLLTGAVGRHLLLYHVGSSSIRRGCYTRGVDTFQFERPHPMLTSEERGELCRCLNHKKSTLEAWKGPSSQRLPKLQTPMTKQRRVVVGEEEALGLVQGLNLRRVQGRVA